MTLRGLPPRGLSEQDYKTQIKRNWRPPFHSKVTLSAFIKVLHYLLSHLFLVLLSNPSLLVHFTLSSVHSYLSILHYHLSILSFIAVHFTLSSVHPFLYSCPFYTIICPSFLLYLSILHYHLSILSLISVHFTLLSVHPFSYTCPFYTIICPSFLLYLSILHDDFHTMVNYLSIILTC